MKYYIQTLLETQYFPFYEFLWLCMLGLWWSVIFRLKRIEDSLDEFTNDLLNKIKKETT